MEKHAVPQNIMDVEFKLFGSLTVKQFSYVAISFLTALFFYILPLPGVLKVVFIAITVVAGLSFAFVTINSMPFTTWFGNFVSNLFSSQRKVYKKTPLPPRVLSDVKVTAKKGMSVGKAKDEEADGYLQALLERNNRQSKSTEENNLANNLPEEILAGESQDSKVEDPFATDKAAALDKYFANAAVQSFKKYNPLESPLKTSAESPQLSKSASVEEVSPAPKLQVISELKPNQIAGFVVDKAGNPIPVATIAIVNSADGKSLSVFTDDKGKFIVPNALQNGTYQISIQAEGFVFPEFTLQLSGELIPLYKYMSLNGK